ncbi:MAG: prepilin-type N-terminal cleavage/methylation domain-containing protein [Thermodesulfobacteriota bacterium]
MLSVRAQRSHPKGFTLIEVVIALAILGIGLVVIMELFSGGLRLGRTSGEYTVASNYARMKMEEIRLNPSVQEGTEEGEFNGLYRWQVEVKKIEVLPLEKNRDFNAPAELFQVKVHVIWKSGGKERSMGLETYQTAKEEGNGNI